MTARKRKPPALRSKRAYEPPSPADGRRILIDRLWPRGLTKNRARIDHWARAIAPSDALRTWYRHEPDKWPEFRRRYFAELDANPEGVAALREQLGVDATLVFSSREAERGNARALLEYLSRRRRVEARPRADHARAQRNAEPRSTKRGVSWAALRGFVLAFPGMSEGTSYGQPAFLLDGKFFARFNEKEQGFVVHAEEGLRDALLSGKPDAYFTTPHYANYPALLVRLPRVQRGELEALIEAAFRSRAKRARVAELETRRAPRLAPPSGSPRGAAAKIPVDGRPDSGRN